MNIGYIPIIDGHDARWQNFQLCYAANKGRFVPRVVSLEKVKEQIKLSKINRKKRNLAEDNTKYGFRRVEIDI
jgi:hypothetical protein